MNEEIYLITMGDFYEPAFAKAVAESCAGAIGIAGSWIDKTFHSVEIDSDLDSMAIRHWVSEDKQVWVHIEKVPFIRGGGE